MKEINVVSTSAYLRSVKETEGEAEDGVRDGCCFQEHEVADDPGQAEHHGHGGAAEHFIP